MFGSRSIFYMLILPAPEIILLVTYDLDVHMEYPLGYLIDIVMMSVGAGLYIGAIFQP
jgi:hypothetical protein